MGGHGEEGFGVAFGIIDRMVGVLCFPQVFEVDEHVALQAFVEGSEIRRAVSERIFSQEMMEVPVHELPVEAVVVGNEESAPSGMLFEPLPEVRHDLGGIVEPEGFLTGESADREGFRDEAIRNGLQPTVEGLFQSRLNDDGAEGDHGIVAGDGAIGFNVDHDVGHGEKSGKFHRGDAEDAEKRTEEN